MATKPKADLTQDQIKRILSYNPETGDFTWLERISIRIMPGRKAGSVNAVGYVSIGIYGRDYLGHRLAWVYVHGRWPPNDIDHINGVRHDNRLCNLREATRSQNHQNRRRNKRSSSGVKGVCWVTGRKRWMAQLVRPDGSKFCRHFTLKEDAANAYRLEAERVYGEFARVA